ncbi:dioxygenase family protein [Enhygromyxa salina]|nr:dioxygenase [Enhygromyxa salina]
MSRRAFVGLTTLGAAAFACGETGVPAARVDSGDHGGPVDPILGQTCAPPSPGGGCELTPADIEGPFYLPDSPERSNLDTLGEAGVALALSGLVSDAACAPLASVIIEIWHADPSGAYDNSATHNYRGWVRSDADGRYAFTTLIPGRYPNAGTLRPAHIHLKIWRDGAEQLTTQLYFQGDPYLEEDPWAEPARTICLEPHEDGFAGVFDINI